MAYYYTDPRRESDPHALPDVEVWQGDIYEVTCHRCKRDTDESSNPACIECHDDATEIDITDEIEVEESQGFDCIAVRTDRQGWFYAFGLPGCLYDSDISGPYATEADALDNAREQAGIECDDAPCAEHVSGEMGECSVCGWSYKAHEQANEAAS